MINGTGQLMASFHQTPQASRKGRAQSFFNILPAVVFSILSSELTSDRYKRAKVKSSDCMTRILKKWIDNRARGNEKSVRAIPEVNSRRDGFETTKRESRGCLEEGGILP